ncbi:Bug family tripartite tricarboxylate transporter substrate binding protein [Bordetella bronchiseptica]|uniref:Bug family tripartite tricarboxylate transporter substrate binding protein n=1 Tax=Bordetella bronchiseptica TaxID=518 RepID=UPI00049F39E8|nr:tripartite tricarboxylate transporter substrate binding protein [Bordetella bronchiseptica]AZW14837.1 tripartite tricarboxylate transporter substrate binding protein [Bordetella bronchiseptica]KDC64003.1 tripartite tricarboxylate transporter family receptor [Bordetella bronchiseptica MBORD624]KDC82086.1 tripartite tricarboxylate transporter family receptor [Bordetella bronchiseptica MBORD668]KDC83502.1 tripartite tricarboxylate transporter family receptor [Bordetella bronchiseptica MBORD665]
MKLRNLIAGGLAATALGLGSVAAAAYPDKPIRIIVPFPAGGATDVVARMLGARLGEELGQSVIVENRSGAGGNIGADTVARSPADGYTLLVGSPAEVAINPLLYAKMPYDPAKDLVAVARVASAPLVLVVNARSPAHSVADLLAQIKGKDGAANYASSGTGGPQHLAGEWFRLESRAGIAHIPYKGGAPAMTDLLGGQVDMFFSGLPPALAHLKAGKLRALAVTTPQRSALLPEVPTMAEQGFAGFAIENWQGVFAPAGTPPEVIKLLSGKIGAITREPGFAERLQAQGASPAFMDAGDMARFVDAERWKYGKLVKESGAKAD